MQSISGRGLLLVGSQDKGLSLWTLQGGLVGRFGLHTWRLTDDHTWQDPMVRCECIPHGTIAVAMLTPDDGDTRCLTDDHTWQDVMVSS